MSNLVIAAIFAFKFWVLFGFRFYEWLRGSKGFASTNNSSSSATALATNADKQLRKQAKRIKQLGSENQSLQMQIITLENKLDQKITEDAHMQNKVDLLELHVKHVADLEDKRSQEHKQFLILSNNIDHLSAVIDSVEEQSIINVQNLDEQIHQELEICKKNINISKNQLDGWIVNVGNIADLIDKQRRDLEEQREDIKTQDERIEVLTAILTILSEKV